MKLESKLQNDIGKTIQPYISDLYNRVADVLETILSDVHSHVEYRARFSGDVKGLAIRAKIVFGLFNGKGVKELSSDIQHIREQLRIWAKAEPK